MPQNKTPKVERPPHIPAENDYRGFNCKFNALTQRNVENWHELMEADEKLKTAGLPIRNGIVVRSAFKAGWFELPVISISADADPILDWPPDRINWLANLITDKYLEVMYIDPT